MWSPQDVAGWFNHVLVALDPSRRIEGGGGGGGTEGGDGGGDDGGVFGGGDEGEEGESSVRIHEEEGEEEGDWEEEAGHEAGQTDGEESVADAGEQGDGKPADLEELQTTYVAHDLIQPRSPLAPVDHPGQKTLTLPGQLFTGAIDEAAGIWEPTPFLRAVYPRGVEGCWLVDSVTPD